MQLQAQQSIWTRHCGIISLNININIEPVYISPDQRVILCRISHVNKVFPSFTIMNLYAPATCRERYNFYANLLTTEYFSSLSNDIHSSQLTHSDSPAIITGDFNYQFLQFPSTRVNQHLADNPNALSMLQPNRTTTTPSIDLLDEDLSMPQIDTNDNPTLPLQSIGQWIWHWIMTQHYTESTHRLQTEPCIPTFRRQASSTTIDYLFLNPILSSIVTSSEVQFISNDWTDHALLSVQLRFESVDHGKGIWRANPSLAKNVYFKEQLYNALYRFHQDLSDLSTTPMVQHSWDDIKELTKMLAQKIGRSKGEWRQRQMKRLQRKRNRLLRLYKTTTLLHDRLPLVEQQISAIQQEIVDNQALRSGLRWREKGEKCAGVLKRTIRSKAQQRTIPDIIHPSTGLPCEDPHHKQQGVQHFYQVLYTPEAINHNDLTFFSDQIPQCDRIPADKHEHLCSSITLDDIQEGASRSPNKSSPGPDGLPYEILCLLFQHPATGKLATQVYNDAPNNSIFPPSWLVTCMVLLPKKGDLSLLQNWRPISLINADAKIYTRLINARLMTYMNKCLTTNQMGFMPKRFIGEQGMIVQCLQEIAIQSQSKCIALLLDQQKACDRIHFNYLQECMTKFNIPSTIIQSIITLFSNTMIQVNVNGFLTAPFQQNRGLRQGDPLSPLLFNIAFDPLLRAVHTSQDIQGFQLQREAAPRFDSSVQHLSHSLNTLDISNASITDTNSPDATTIKIIAYADDTLVTLRNHNDFLNLQQILARYMNASNARLNYGKTQVLSLSGAPHPEWQAFLQSHGVHHWHDSRSPTPLTYLGYAICSSPQQRSAHAQTIIANLKKQCQIFSSRSLTYRGKVTIMNSLIFAKLWHMSRLFSFSKTEMSQIQQIAASFINRDAKVSRFSFATLTLHRKQGGLQLIDPQQQALAFQWRWLHFLLHPSQPTPTHMPSIPVLRFTLQYILNTPEYPTYQWSLLFPHCRPVIPRYHGPVVNLLRAADHIQQPTQHCTTDISTCLQLPLFELLLPTVPTSHPDPDNSITPTTFLSQHPSMRKLRGFDIFHFNSERLHLEFNDIDILPQRSLRKHIIQLIQANQLSFHQFVLFNFLPHVLRTVPSSTNNPLDIHPLSSFLISKLSSHFNTESFTFELSPPQHPASKLYLSSPSLLLQIPSYLHQNGNNFGISASRSKLATLGIDFFTVKYPLENVSMNSNQTYLILTVYYVIDPTLVGIQHTLKITNTLCTHVPRKFSFGLRP